VNGYAVRRGAAAAAVAIVLLMAVLVATTPVADAAYVTAPPPVQTRIMPLGASSTEGLGSPATGGYRGPLFERLTAAGIPADFVGSQHQGSAPAVQDADHEGHSGWTIEDMKPKVRGWIREHRPDIILLHMGTNDLVQGVSGLDATKRLEGLLNEIAAETPATVIVAGVWAPLEQMWQFAEKGKAMAARLKAAGRHVRFADTAQLLGPGDFADNLHANAGGYQKIAAMWEREIKGVFGR
jgi:acyl-CoA thioesterase-1